MGELCKTLPSPLHVQLWWTGILTLETKTVFIPGCEHVYSCGKAELFKMGFSKNLLDLAPASRGHLRNCSFWHFRVGFICQPPSLAIDIERTANFRQSMFPNYHPLVKLNKFNLVYHTSQYFYSVCWRFRGFTGLCLTAHVGSSACVVFPDAPCRPTEDV